MKTVKFEKFKALFLWDNLAVFGKNRFVRSSYFWMVFVPLVAKLLASFPDPIKIEGFVTAPIHLNQILPFSWYYFYFASILLAFGALFFSLRCPRIIKDHKDYYHFDQSGKTLKHLAEYGGELGEDPVKLHQEMVSNTRPPIPEDGDKADILREMYKSKKGAYFWNLRAAANTYAWRSRVLIGFLFFFGTMAFVYVIFQNFLFVINLFIAEG